MKKILSENDILPIQNKLLSGIDRQTICNEYNMSFATLTRFLNSHLRDFQPPGNCKKYKDYFVYNDGKIWSTRLFSWIKPSIDRDGYATLGESFKEIFGERKVHRLILRLFDREPHENEICRHLDGNTTNNHIENLRWGTTQQNQYDRIKMARHYGFLNFKKKPNFFVTKTYGHNLGLSACFRQWRAKSHCAHFHGYSLSFTFMFSCVELDQHGWVIDFGSLKPIKGWLENTFDHKLLVAHDDPELDHILKLEELNIANVIIVQDVGCEAFAKMAFYKTEEWLTEMKISPRVWIQNVTVKEHESNGVTYEPYNHNLDVFFNE